jgi:hypothetical protein
MIRCKSSVWALVENEWKKKVDLPRWWCELALAVRRVEDRVVRFRCYAVLGWCRGSRLQNQTRWALPSLKAGMRMESHHALKGMARDGKLESAFAQMLSTSAQGDSRFSGKVLENKETGKKKE